jgi:hypothetical protein
MGDDLGSSCVEPIDDLFAVDYTLCPADEVVVDEAVQEMDRGPAQQLRSIAPHGDPWRPQRDLDGDGPLDERDHDGRDSAPSWRNGDDLVKSQYRHEFPQYAGKTRSQ